MKTVVAVSSKPNAPKPEAVIILEPLRFRFQGPYYDGREWHSRKKIPKMPVTGALELALAAVKALSKKGFSKPSDSIRSPYTLMKGAEHVSFDIENTELSIIVYVD